MCHSKQLIFEEKNPLVSGVQRMIKINTNEVEYTLKNLLIVKNFLLAFRGMKVSYSSSLLSSDIINLFLPKIQEKLKS